MATGGLDGALGAILGSIGHLVEDVRSGDLSAFAEFVDLGQLLTGEFFDSPNTGESLDGLVFCILHGICLVVGDQNERRILMFDLSENFVESS